MKNWFIMKIKWAFPKWIILLFLFSCGTPPTNSEGNISDKAEKTNIVFILIDDLSHLGVSAYGANRLSSNEGLFQEVTFATPNIDQLAKEGILFTEAHVYPLCEPTRIALMTGMYNSRNFLRCKSQHASDITFGDVFKKAGYATGIFGKWKQTRGTNEIPGKDYIYEFGWDEFACFDVIMEGQRFINPNLVINGEIIDYNGRNDVDPLTGRRWYGPDICNRYALDFIDKNKEQPFFLYYPMLLVHDDHKPTPDTKPLHLFDNFDEANHNKNGHKGDDRRYFPDMISYMDKLIGKVVDRLNEHGLREKTLIIVMGDNGTKETFTHVWPNGSKYPARKGGTSDNGTHIPLVFNQPGTIAPKEGQHKIKTYDGLVDVTDIFPTICDAAGIENPQKGQLDGISFWQQIMGMAGEHRKVIYTWYNGNDPHTSDALLLRYAFNKDFKYYAPDKEYPNGRFFDLRIDSLERAGDNYKERRWGVRLYNGLDIKNLTEEQTEAYNELKQVVASNDYVPVREVKILNGNINCKRGEKIQFSYQVLPTSATRKNIVWNSDNPEVASIDKFGALTAHKKGKVIVSLYSWDDAYPLSANQPLTFSKDGIQDEIMVKIY